MSENDDVIGAAAEPEVKTSKISIVWLLPAIAVLLGGWLLFKSIRDRGTSIEIMFATADGLEAGKTAIRYLDVHLGVVDEIHVTEDRKRVVVTATIDRKAEDTLVESTTFWVVRPRATLKGISGLGTLLSGAYISMDPGEGAAKTSFVGLDEPPVLDADAPGARFTLHADTLGSISVGSPIYFRGMATGEVISRKLDDDAAGVTIKVFVNDPHHHLVREHSRFWNASGISASAGANGLEIETASFEAMLIGGIEFDSPKQTPASPKAKDGTEFKLYPRKRDIDEDRGGGERYVCFFEETLRGLSVGAPVEFRGIEVGRVDAIDVRRDDEGTLRLPVTLELYPDRYALAAASNEAERRERLTEAIAGGLRATLKSGSLLTGALFVDMVDDGETPVRLLASSVSSLPEIPTTTSGLEAIEKSITSAVRKLDSILTKIDDLPIDELVQNASNAAASIDKLAASPDLAAAIKSAHEVLVKMEPVMDDLQTVLRDADAGIKTIVEETRKTTEQLRETLTAAEKTFAGVDQSIGPDSQALADLRSSLNEMEGAARALRQLSSYLERHPEALIRGKSDNGGR